FSAPITVKNMKISPLSLTAPHDRDHSGLRKKFCRSCVASAHKHKEPLRFRALFRAELFLRDPSLPNDAVLSSVFSGVSFRKRRFRKKAACRESGRPRCLQWVRR
ncbi:MAG: hypothetical protein LUE95_04670, partial [Oscillospiraceae bacterium]|nr:hypothetical protein [Oscillospiraceae bacterium]